MPETNLATLDLAALESFEQRLAHAKAFLHVDELQQTVDELSKQSSDASFWDDAQAARKAMERLTQAKQTLARL